MYTVDGLSISGFVMQKAQRFDRVRCLDVVGDGAVFVAEFATRLITVQQRFGDAGVANDFVAQVACNALRAIAPEDNSLLHVDACRRRTGRSAGYR